MQNYQCPGKLSERHRESSTRLIEVVFLSEQDTKCAYVTRLCTYLFDKLGMIFGRTHNQISVVVI
ncbi:hypothetical protein NCAS_0J00130 [Naumovozyma castellii]|uniref:Uncharacterized protein n=1 Tax=Naumovozyma castellii TaxID=27288 RepID=G0VKF9_NAUCA|nr:hypothetical protein NCAS_0J00130 [Naumovozyma castellii CBS 4309]CCC71993.1 hypothetical protein NCAS_0J00130 [Naumovozyma castellii CBS 4309]